MITNLRKNLLIKSIIIIVLSTLILLFGLINNKVEAVSKDKIHFISTGGSDAILIESNGMYGIVDTSNVSNKNDTLTKKGIGYVETWNGARVKQYLKALGVKKLDFILLTHAHSDHLGGMPDMKDFIDKSTVVFYKPFKNSHITYEAAPTKDNENAWNTKAYYDIAINAAASKGAVMFDTSVGNNTSAINTVKSRNSRLKNIKFIKDNKTKTNVDDVVYFEFGNYKISLYNLYYVSSNSENSNSIVTLIQKGTQKIALLGDINNYSNVTTGDTSKGVGDQIADAIGKVTILKAGHHGGSASNSFYEISKYNPANIVITSNITSHSSNTENGKISLIYGYLKKINSNCKFYVTTGQQGNSNGAIVFEINNNNVVAQDYNLSGKYVKAAVNSDLSKKNTWVYTCGSSTSERIWAYYGPDGKLVTGWKKLEYKGKTDWYYFNNQGFMQKGWQKIDGKWYYLNESGQMQTGWIKSNNKWYYLNSSGAMLTGWQKISGKWYYLNSSGQMQTGWIKSNNKWYYLNASGVMLTGWQKIDGKWYYLCRTNNEINGYKEGAMITGRHLLEYNGEKNYYYFCVSNNIPNGYKEGQMISNITFNGHKYDASGKEDTKVVKTQTPEQPQQTTTTNTPTVTQPTVATPTIPSPTVTQPNVVVDRVAPTVTVKHSNTNITNQNVVVTITANEAVQAVSGWSLSSDRLVLTKTYLANTSETVVVKDLSGNERYVEIRVTNIDKTAPNLGINYSTTSKTTKDVKVTIISNEAVQKVPGWELSSNKLYLSKIYTTNTKETVTVKDLSGNEKQIQVNVNNIEKNNSSNNNNNSQTITNRDTTPPKITVGRSVTGSSSMILVIKSNEEIMPVAGWSLSSDKLKLVKTFKANGEETITIRDLSGNVTSITIKITNIQKGTVQITKNK